MGNFIPAILGILSSALTLLVKGLVDKRVYFGWKDRYKNFDALEERYLKKSLELIYEENSLI